MSDAFRHTMLHGGGTFGVIGNGIVLADPESGFVVGISEGTAVTVRVGLTDATDVVDAAIRYLDRQHGSLVGTWLEDGRIHIDPVAIYLNKDNALEVARKFKQAAIFDATTKEVINL